MTARARRATPLPGENPGLFAVDDAEPSRSPGRRRLLRHEKAVNACLRATGIDRMPRYQAAVTLARSLAAQLDQAEVMREVYATPQLAKGLQDVLKELGLLEAVGGGDDDGLGGLGGPTVEHATLTE